MRFKVANYSRLEIRLDTLHIYTGLLSIRPKIVAAPNWRIWLHAWMGPHLIFQFRGGIFISRP